MGVLLVCVGGLLGEWNRHWCRVRGVVLQLAPHHNGTIRLIWPACKFPVALLCMLLSMCVGVPDAQVPGA